MGLQLPGELISLLGMLGYNWPEGDEEGVFNLGHSWVGFSGDFTDPLGDSASHAQRVWSENQGEGIEAFRNAWAGSDSPKTNLEDGTTAATMIGAGLFVCAGIVLALKVNVIVQLISLAIEIAQAIATAVVTFGASLAEIPIFKEITSLFIDQLINLALDAVLGG
jgi:hypothetical protein